MSNNIRWLRAKQKFHVPEHEREYFGEAADEIERLQTDTTIQQLRQFLDEICPKEDGPGWVQRLTKRGGILSFLREFEATKAAKGDESWVTLLSGYEIMTKSVGPFLEGQGNSVWQPTRSNGYEKQ